MMKHRWEWLAPLIIDNNVRTMMEIGISRGNTVLGIQRLLDAACYKLDEYYGLDPYIDKYYAATPREIADMKIWEPFIMINDTSDRFFDMIKGKKEFDMVFIDGSHVPAQMCKDIANYSQVVRDGGILSGHDYNSDIVNQYGNYADVTTFLNSFVGAENINVRQDMRFDEGHASFLWYTFKVDGKWSKDTQTTTEINASVQPSA